MTGPAETAPGATRGAGSPGAVSGDGGARPGSATGADRVADRPAPEADADGVASGRAAWRRWTPLVDVPHPDLPAGVVLRAKLESVHPGGSIKDRPIARIVRRALERGDVRGRRLLDSSSGNAGIAYAQRCAALGVPLTLVVPANATRERLDRIRAHGAELVLTDPMEGYDATIGKARALARRHPDRYWYANQYGNEDNWLAHYYGTAAELLAEWTDTLGRALPDAFVTGIGTGGTLTGVGRRLKIQQGDARIVAVIPERFPGIEGLKPLGQPDDHVPEILDETLIDDRIPVTSEQAADRCAELARLGLFVGPSSGANVHAALELAASGRARRIATVLPDTGERYVSTGLWSSEGGAG